MNDGRKTWRHMATLATICLLAGPCLAGSVLTAAGRQEGKVALGDNALTLDGKAVDWPAVLVVVTDNNAATLPARNLVRARSGEAWYGDILAVSAKQVEINCYGKHSVDREAVSSLEFTPGVAAEELSAKTLYREKNEPVPGALLWVDDNRLAIDSPLGVLTLQREGTIRYVFDPAADEALPEGQDEVQLLDGCIFRGKFSLGAKTCMLEHKTLGKLSLPTAAVRAIRRRPAGATYLADLKPASAKTAPLVDKAPTAARFACGYQAVGGNWLGFMKSLRIEPETTVKFQLPKEATAGGTLLTRLSAPEGAKGTVLVRISADGKPLAEHKLAPQDKPIDVQANLPAGKDLTLEVLFEKPLRFPAAVVLQDPVIVAKPES